jgi:AcrR family transcriptional regulator
LGRDEAGANEAGSASPRRDAARTRARLLEALSALLERQGFEAVTAAAISSEAGLAHGTFYRHFTDKTAALEALFEEFRATIERARPSFEGELGDLAAERARVRAWLAAIFENALERPGLLRAYYLFVGMRNEAVREEKLARRLALRASLARYFEALTAAGLADIAEPAALAAALLAIIDGALHVAVLEGRPFDPLTLAGATDVYDRAIFGRRPPRADGNGVLD